MIRKLPEAVIREIAAGEVITAPVDVLRELLDNALDAGASRVAVTLEGGGITNIQVEDNGSGIPKDQLALALAPHATSKLTSLDNIQTLGFRGEGLFAIATAATVSLTSRPSTQLVGATLELPAHHHNMLESHLETQPIHDHPGPAGTSITVRELFAHMPARLAALDSASMEEKRCLHLTQRYIIHYPHLAVAWQSDAQQWSYAGGTFVDASKFVWGTLTSNRLVDIASDINSEDINLKDDVDDGAGNDVHISGLISRPELSRPRRDRLLLAINGRPVHWHDALVNALLEAYGELLPAGHYPVGIINLTLPHNAVVVNVSPDKRHVKLRDSDALAKVLEEAVRTTLAGHPLAPALPDFAAASQLTPVSSHAFPDLNYVGQYRELYLLAEAGSELWVIDQHAAHERIVFEELERRYMQEVPLELTAPELLPMTEAEVASYLAKRDELANRGVVLEPFGAGVNATTWRVRSIPAFLVGHENLIPNLVKDSLNGDDVSTAWRRILARLACLPAIRAGHVLIDADAQDLLDGLAACQTPWVCPHGRPTALVLDELELARRFGRRGVRSVKQVYTNQTEADKTPISKLRLT
ncbi:MAG: DNA mismatch repair endonuclease MutL [Deinococcota bacterium]